MPGIPPLLRTRLRETLLRCAPCDSDRALRAVFTDARLNAWYNDVPEATTPAERIDGLLDKLHDRYDARGDHALALLCTVLAEQIADACRAHLTEMATLIPSPDLTGLLRPVRSEAYTRVPDPRASRLVGRDAELEWLCARLERGDVSALAGVRGIGGIGKTELAIAAARALDDHFAGRVLWLDCGLNAVLAIQERVAAVLGVKLEGDDLMQRADVLSRAWRGQPPTLVVLDDVRAAHLQDFVALLPPRPPCALLVTSRRHDLPSLPPGALRYLKVLDPAPSQTLIADLLSVDVEPDPQAAGGIVELLDCVPLALTLAARRLARLAERRRAPGTDSPWRVLLRDLQERRARVLHQGERPDLSVWVAFGASYDDLADPDKKRLRRLGVFARSEFALPALLAVWEDEEVTGREALMRLTDAGLLEEVDDDVWWMHDLLREYVLAQLAQDDAEAQAARLAHAAYWRAYLNERERLSLSDWDALEICRPEIERAADWLLPDHALLNPWLSAALAFVIDQKFQIYAFPHGETWLRAGLSAAQYLLEEPSTDETDEFQRAVGALQSSLAALLSTRGQYAEAERLYDSGLTICRAIRDPQGVAVFLMGLGRLALDQGRHDEALPLLREARAGFAALGLHEWVAAVDRLLAQAGENRHYTD